jgi:O-antigen ligase
MLVGLGLFAAVALVNPVVDLGLERRLSLGQVIDNVLSVLSDSDDSATQAQLQGTKRFRLAWWNTIIDYTVNGPYFWTGKGFGVNLADDDGFQISADGSLRAPHNGHIEVLARMGVPGLVLWIVFNLGFAIALARRAAGRGPPVRRAIFAWLFVYWAAMVVNASFDPYLQGPQGGIWYWTVVGIGLALIARPETAEIDTEEADEADEADAEHVLGIRAPSGAGAA